MNDTAKRLLKLLESRRGEFSPNNPTLDKFDHSLQCASRAWRAGESADYVVMCLFHDVFGGFSADQHGVMAGMTLAPWLSERSLRAVSIHVAAMAELRDSAVVCYDAAGRQVTAEYPESKEFAEKYDMPSFDPAYDAFELGDFRHLIDQVMPEDAESEATVTRYAQ